MSESVAIRTEGLSKTFGSGDKAVEAVKDLDLSIDSGQVYGFLGPNGAGKSTTIRMMVDLVRPTKGEAYIFGKAVGEHNEVLRPTGAMVETPGFYDYLSGRNNLKVLADTSGEYEPDRIEQLLIQLGLEGRADQPVANYSTGMKQRLGVVTALLNDPDLIILDEPTNGLDPNGIQEMRTFIRDLVDTQGKTVFLTSHILHEVEQVCDRVAIINKGELIREGAVSDLLSSHVDELRIEADPVDKTVGILAEAWQVETDGNWVEVTAAPEEAPAIVRQLVDQGVDIRQVVVTHHTLEEYFMEVTEDS